MTPTHTIDDNRAALAAIEAKFALLEADMGDPLRLAQRFMVATQRCLNDPAWLRRQLEALEDEGRR